MGAQAGEAGRLKRSRATQSFPQTRDSVSSWTHRVPLPPPPSFPSHLSLVLAPEREREPVRAVAREHLVQLLARLEDDDPPAERRHVDGRAGRAVGRVEAEAAAMPVGVPVDVEVEQESDLPLEAHLARVAVEVRRVARPAAARVEAKLHRGRKNEWPPPAAARDEGGQRSELAQQGERGGSKPLPRRLVGVEREEPVPRPAVARVDGLLRPLCHQTA
mmetsp:Transcript_3848/g.12940  ORF Transcript_3848/g.12940 Transcript_3848/m.12940 type:complete len:218 (-) Transcript_3848:693-1346(-)